MAERGERQRGEPRRCRRSRRTCSQAATRRKRSAGSKAEAVARRYFEAIDAHDLDGAAAMWAAGRPRERARPGRRASRPEGVREFIGEPDRGDARPAHGGRLDDRPRASAAACSGASRGTFAGPGALRRRRADRATAIELEGFDLLTRARRADPGNDAFTDSMTFARQIGMMPPQGSAAEQRMTGAFNVKTRLSASLGAGEAELVADGRVGRAGAAGALQRVPDRERRREGGVTLFDAGARTMTRAVASAGREARRHHAGSCSATATPTTAASRPRSGVPVLCHPDEVQDAEGSGGFRYWPADLAGLPTGPAPDPPLLHRYAWDGGPVKIAGHRQRGRRGRRASRDRPARPRARPDRAVARVRPAGARQRLLLHARHVGPQLRAASCRRRSYNYDTEQARASIRKLAEMEPAAAWPGHAKPVTGDVRGQLLKRAADAPGLSRGQAQPPPSRGDRQRPRS